MVYWVAAKSEVFVEAMESQFQSNTDIDDEEHNNQLERLFGDYFTSRSPTSSNHSLRKKSAKLFLKQQL